MPRSGPAIPPKAKKWLDKHADLCFDPKLPPGFDEFVTSAVNRGYERAFMKENASHIIAESRNPERSMIFRVKLFGSYTKYLTAKNDKVKFMKYFKDTIEPNLSPIYENLMAIPTYPEALRVKSITGLTVCFENLIHSLFNIATEASALFRGSESEKEISSFVNKVLKLREHLQPARGTVLPEAVFNDSDEEFALWQGKTPRGPPKAEEVIKRLNDYKSLKPIKGETTEFIVGIEDALFSDVDDLMKLPLDDLYPGTTRVALYLACMRFCTTMWEYVMSTKSTLILENNAGMMRRTFSLTHFILRCLHFDPTTPGMRKLRHAVGVFSSILGRCAECQKSASLKCSRCALERYCSKECQIEAWPEHKIFCSPKPLNEYFESLIQTIPWPTELIPAGDTIMSQYHPEFYHTP